MEKLVAFSALMILFSGCSRTIDCQNPYISFSFISNRQNILDTLVIRKFAKDNNFQTPLDTLKVTSLNARVVNRGDTSTVFLNDPDKNLKSGFDWQIFIPALNRTVNITQIVKRDKMTSCGTFETNSCFCYDDISSLKLDNQTGVLYANQLYIR